MRLMLNLALCGLATKVKSETTLSLEISSHLKSAFEQNPERQYILPMQLIFSSASSTMKGWLKRAAAGMADLVSVPDWNINRAAAGLEMLPY